MIVPSMKMKRVNYASTFRNIDLQGRSSTARYGKGKAVMSLKIKLSFLYYIQLIGNMWSFHYH